MNIHALIDHIEQTALPEIAASWDLSGIQLAGEKQDISLLAVALDPNVETINSALHWGADCILTHHPLSLRPYLPKKNDNFFKIVSSLIKNNTWLYAAHTSLDSQPNGPVAWLAKDLGLIDTEIIEPGFSKQALKFRFLQNFKDHSTWQSFSQRPDLLESRVCTDNFYEVLCWEDRSSEVKNAILKKFEPAWIEYQNLAKPVKNYGLGCIGNLPETLCWAEFAIKLKNIFGHAQFKCAGSIPHQVKNVAYCPGSGASLINKAFAMGAQIYITGDIKYHEAQNVKQGLVIDAGHFLLEEIMMQRYALQLKNELVDQDIKIQFFTGHDALQLVDLTQTKL